MDWLDDQPCSSGAPADATPGSPELRLHDWLCEVPPSGADPTLSLAPTMDWLDVSPAASQSAPMDWADDGHRSPHADDRNPQICDWLGDVVGLGPAVPSESPTLAVVPYEKTVSEVNVESSALQVVALRGHRSD